MDLTVWKKHRLVLITVLLITALLIVSMLRNSGVQAASGQVGSAANSPSPPGMSVAMLRSEPVPAASAGGGQHLQWDMSAIPSAGKVTAAYITLNETGVLAGRKTLLQSGDGTGGEGAVVLGTVSPGAGATMRINLNPAGLALVQSWIGRPGNNRGFVLKNAAATAKPILTLIYE